MADLLDDVEFSGMSTDFRQSLLKVAFAILGKEAASPLLHKLRNAAKRPVELVTGSRADKLEAAARSIGGKLDTLAIKPGAGGKLQQLVETVTGVHGKRRAARVRLAKALGKVDDLAATENAKVHAARKALGVAALGTGAAVGAKQLTAATRKRKESAMEKDSAVTDAVKTVARRLGGKAVRAVKRPVELLTGSRHKRLLDAAFSHAAADSKHLHTATRARVAADAIRGAKDAKNWPQAAALEAHAVDKMRSSLGASKRHRKASRKLLDLSKAERGKAHAAQDAAVLGSLAAVPAGAAVLAKKRKDRQREKRASLYDEAETAKIACVRELLRLNAISEGMAKAATVSPETARRAMDRLSGMEETKPGVGQVARYAGIGGGGGAAIAALGNVIEGYKRPTSPGIKGHLAALGRAAVRADKNPRVGDKVRSIASTAVKGALGAGVIPLARTGTDRAAERRTLKKYIAQHASEHANA